MKLFASFSEAIREGARLRPQAFGSMSRDERSCAFGAGYEALNESLNGVSVVPVEQAYSYLTNQSQCPVSECDEDIATDQELPVITDVIIHLNDDHHWSREQIADWLESEEEKLGYILVIEAEQSTEVTSPAHPLGVGVG